MHCTYLKKSNVIEVATIISHNYKTAKLQVPFLSNKYENVLMNIKQLKEYVDNKNFVVLIDVDRVVGFINGIYIDEFKGTAKGALSLPSLHGVAKGYDKNYIYNELYRRVSDLWVNLNCYTHAIMLFANDKDTINSWVMNGFGMLVIDAVRPLKQILLPNMDDSISIRQAGSTDLANMKQLFKGLDEHLASSPVYLYGHNSKNYVNEYYEWHKIKGNILWIAQTNNKIIGYLKTNINEINMDELNDGYTMGINGAYVLPEYRGMHIMSRLLNTATNWATSIGLKRCSTDFEAANIEGRNFWLKHFTPYCYSMIRRIDERNYII